MRDENEESYERLDHIQTALKAIEVYTTGVDENDFITDDLIKDAVLFQFSIIGEAIKHVEKAKLDKYDYPWFKVRAFRNFISHEYYRIDFHAVWMVINQDVPKLKSIVEEILTSEF